MLTITEVTFAFADGVISSVRTEPGRPVLDAALAAGLPMLHQCKSGTCSSCLATLVEGKAERLAGASSTLLPSEREQGHRLLCVTEALTDCRFNLAYDSAAGATRPVNVHAFVNAVDRIASDVMRLELELAEGAWLDFRPGQFIQVKVPGTGAMRSYSIATTPAQLPRVELLIRLLPGGVMSDWLLERARIDDVLELSGPYGAFFLKDGIKAPHIMIAGGTGLAPLLSMIDTIRARPGRKPPMLLSFGCQTGEGLFHREEIDLRAHWLPSLDVRLSIDRGPAPEGASVGNPVEIVGEDAPLDPASIAYLCGPPGMVRAAREHLERLGVATTNIHAEQFVATE